MLFRCQYKQIACRIVVVVLNVFAGCQVVSPDPSKEIQPRWWKGNWHTHSQWSDGNAFPETVVKWYMDHGYHFLALSDHRTTGQGELWKDVLDRRSKGKAFDVYMEQFGWDWVELRQQQDVHQDRCKPLKEYEAAWTQPAVPVM